MKNKGAVTVKELSQSQLRVESETHWIPSAGRSFNACWFRARDLMKVM
jgi:hypothetical protein